MKTGSDGDYAVLFVDDEEKALKYFRMAFAKSFPVLTAGSVPEALAVLERQGPEIGVLITDQRMPGQSGVELLKRAREDWPGIVRILTTAYSDLDDAIAAVNRGEILRYVTKPWDVAALRLELRHAMDFFLLRRERDLLLEAKLSVRSKMRQAERLRALIAIAGALERLRGAPAAVAAWARADGAAPWEEAVASQELWGAEVEETLRLLGLARRMRALDNLIVPGYPDLVSLPALLADLGIRASGEAPEVSGRATLLLRLCGELAQLAGSPAEARLGEADLPAGGRAVALDLTGPSSASADPERLLDACLLAGHHGGILNRTAQTDGVRLGLRLALDPECVAAPEPDADWLAEQFAQLEDWGG